MPYEWITSPDMKDSPQAELHLWPYRSLLRRDFVVFIGCTASLVLLPLLSVLGSPVLWGILPFFLLTLSAIWYALNRSYKDGEIIEELRIWPDRITLHHRSRRGHHEWEANPYWVDVKCDSNHEKVPNYLTLKGANRTVELGAFLSEDERAVLYDEIDRAIRKALTVAT